MYMYNTHSQGFHAFTKSNMSHTHPSAHTPTCVRKSHIYYIHLVHTHYAEPLHPHILRTVLRMCVYGGVRCVCQMRV